MSIYIEFKQQLNVAQVVLRLQTMSSDNSCQVQVKKSSIIIQYQGGENEFRLPEKYPLNPTSCHGLTWTSDGELHMRVRMCGSSTALSPTTGNNDDEQLSLSPPLNQIESSKFWICSSCGHEILKLAKGFERVLPLPSDAWSEMCGNLFCCSHGKKGHDLSINPRKHDCLVGHYYCLVHPDLIKMEESGRVQCKRCHSTVGWHMFDKDKVSAVALKLDFSAISLSHRHSQHTTPASGNKFNWEKFFLQQLCSQKRLHTSYKFLIESRNAWGKLEPHLLVWIFDTNSEQSYNLLEGQTVDILPHPAVKILFKVVVPEKSQSEVETWRQDIAVTPLEYPQPIILRLVSLLTEGSQLLPQSQRYLNGFNVGFLNR